MSSLKHSSPTTEYWPTKQQMELTYFLHDPTACRFQLRNSCSTNKKKQLDPLWRVYKCKAWIQGKAFPWAMSTYLRFVGNTSGRYRAITAKVRVMANLDSIIRVVFKAPRSTPEPGNCGKAKPNITATPADMWNILEVPLLPILLILEKEGNRLR